MLSDYSRRRFLRTAARGLAGAALAGIGSRHLVNSARAAEPLTYAFWPWGSEIVNDSGRIFEEQYGIDLNLQPIPGSYTAVVETKLTSGAPLDMCRAQRGQASRWFAAGWIRPIDDLPDVEQIKNEMFDGIVRDTYSWPDQKFIGLTYYNGGPYTLFRNEKILEAAGFGATGNPADYPQTWDEVYKQAKEIKRKGIVEHPLLPSWFKAWTGTPWALYAHCFSEGETFVDADMKATFGVDTPIYKVLSDWKKWWDDDLVPKAILGWQETQMSNSWAKGLHAFHPWTDYQSFTYADPEKSPAIAAYNHANPVMPGETHDTCLVGHALLMMSNRDRSDEQLMNLWKLMKFYGWRDKNGELLVKKRWARETNLQVPFPEIYDDPNVKQSILKWMYEPYAEKQYAWQFEGRRRAIAPELLRAPWHQEWEQPTQDMIEQEMFNKGSMTPKEVVAETRKLWEKLRDKYT